MAGEMYDGGHEWGKRAMHGEGGVHGKGRAWQEWNACVTWLILSPAVKKSKSNTFMS